ncbi:MAG TPA: ABC transporter substrate-binding protein [Acidimicrobiales bacterium]|nr:ABC transporter substrate-binding protein [Acidimicrobiales bacterium]
MRKARVIASLAAGCLLVAACARSSSNKATSASSTSPTSAAAAGTTAAQCNTTLQATDVGVTPTDITVEVMADVGSPLAPGLFQGNIDALNAYATYVNAHGGIACRKLVVRTWDSKLSPSEAKNGLIDSCQNAFALVGGNALFNPDPSPMTNCVDKNGHPTGLPDVSALANDINEQCAPTSYTVQGVFRHCPIQSGAFPSPSLTAPTKWLLQKYGAGLHGLYLVPGDLPTTVQASTYTIDAVAQAGITWDATPKVSGADAQPAYTPRVQLAKSKGSTFVYDGSNDIAMIRMRKEAAAQGLSSVKVWACSLACYTKAFLGQGGADVEGTYVTMQFLPFEEASYNAEDQAYVSALGSKVDSFGANAWQAAGAFKAAVDSVVKQGGPNAVTRAAVLDALKGLTNFTDNGWVGGKSLKGQGAFSNCYLIMQVQNGKFVRVYPTQPGTMDCKADNVTTVNVDPVAEAANLK